MQHGNLCKNYMYNFTTYHFIVTVLCKSYIKNTDEERDFKIIHESYFLAILMFGLSLLDISRMTCSLLT